MMMTTHRDDRAQVAAHHGIVVPGGSYYSWRPLYHDHVAPGRPREGRQGGLVVVVVAVVAAAVAAVIFPGIETNDDDDDGTVTVTPGMTGLVGQG